MLKQKTLILAPLLLLLSGCSMSDINQNNSGNYTYTKQVTPPKSQKLTKLVVVKSFSVNYHDGSNGSNTVPRQRLDDLVNNYLNSITNLKDYHVVIKTNSVNGSNADANTVEIYTLILTKK